MLRNKLFRHEDKIIMNCDIFIGSVNDNGKKFLLASRWLFIRCSWWRLSYPALKKIVKR